MSYTWLLFDADGTLFDFAKAEEHALTATLNQFAVTPTAEHLSTYRRLNKRVWQELEQGLLQPSALSATRFSRFFAAADISANIPAFSAAYLKNLAACSELLPEAEAVVQALHASHRLIIITNGLKDVQRPRFHRSVIADCFEDIIISEEIGSAKPAAAIFDVAFARMGNPAKSDVLIIGDSLTSDIQGGCDYGIDTCWFNPAGHARSLDLDIRYEIRRLAELNKLVK